MYRTNFITFVARTTWIVVLSLVTLLTSTVMTSEAVKPRVTGSPGGRAPGGTRSPDCVSQRTLTALVPDRDVGLTIAKRPTFFFYIPPTTAQQAVFTLQNEHKKQVYKTTVNLKTTAGITSFTLPTVDRGTELVVGKNYRWSFLMICDAAAPDQSGDPFVQGWIKRVELSPSLQRQLNKAPARDQVTLYQQAGLWYESLSTLAMLRRSAPQDKALANTWVNLLASVGLDQVAREPLIHP